MVSSDDDDDDDGWTGQSQSVRLDVLVSSLRVCRNRSVKTDVIGEPSAGSTGNSSRSLHFLSLVSTSATWLHIIVATLLSNMICCFIPHSANFCSVLLVALTLFHCLNLFVSILKPTVYLMRSGVFSPLTYSHYFIYHRKCTPSSYFSSSGEWLFFKNAVSVLGRSPPSLDQASNFHKYSLRNVRKIMLRKVF